MSLKILEKKDLINKIQKLSVKHQREIFFILRKNFSSNQINQNKNSFLKNIEDSNISNQYFYNIEQDNDDNKWYTKNQNGIFINLSKVDESILNDISNFVDECKDNKDKMLKLHKEIQSIENKEICYKIDDINIIKEIENFNDFNNVMNPKNINNIIDNIHLNKKNPKKNNLQTKFINATKKYNKSIGSDRKIEESIIYYLEYEDYIIK